MEAAVRELQEEVNITVTKTQLDFVGKHSAKYGNVCDVGSFFEIKMSELPEIQVDNREVVWAQFMTLDRALTINMIPTVKSYLDDKIRKADWNGDKK